MAVLVLSQHHIQRSGFVECVIRAIMSNWTMASAALLPAGRQGGPLRALDVRHGAVDPDQGATLRGRRRGEPETAAGTDRHGAAAAQVWWSWTNTTGRLCIAYSRLMPARESGLWSCQLGRMVVWVTHVQFCYAAVALVGRGFLRILPPKPPPQAPS